MFVDLIHIALKNKGSFVEHGFVLLCATLANKARFKNTLEIMCDGIEMF